MYKTPGDFFFADEAAHAENNDYSNMTFEQTQVEDLMRPAPSRSRQNKYGSDGRKCLALICDGNMQQALFEFIQTWLGVLKYYRITATKKVINFLRSNHGADHEVEYGLVCTDPHLGGVAQISTQIVLGQIGGIILLSDPLRSNPYQVHSDSLRHLAHLHNLMIAENVSSADAMMYVLQQGVRERHLIRSFHYGLTSPSILLGPPEMDSKKLERDLRKKEKRIERLEKHLHESEEQHEEVLQKNKAEIEEQKSKIEYQKEMLNAQQNQIYMFSNKLKQNNLSTNTVPNSLKTEKNIDVPTMEVQSSIDFDPRDSEKEVERRGSAVNSKDGFLEGTSAEIEPRNTRKLSSMSHESMPMSEKSNQSMRSQSNEVVVPPHEKKKEIQSKPKGIQSKPNEIQSKPKDSQAKSKNTQTKPKSKPKPEPQIIPNLIPNINIFKKRDPTSGQRNFFRRQNPDKGDRNKFTFASFMDGSYFIPPEELEAEKKREAAKTRFGKQEKPEKARTPNSSPKATPGGPEPPKNLPKAPQNETEKPTPGGPDDVTPGGPETIAEPSTEPPSIAKKDPTLIIREEGVEISQSTGNPDYSVERKMEEEHGGYSAEKKMEEEFGSRKTSMEYNSDYSARKTSMDYHSDYSANNSRKNTEEFSHGSRKRSEELVSPRRQSEKQQKVNENLENILRDLSVDAGDIPIELDAKFCKGPYGALFYHSIGNPEKIETEEILLHLDSFIRKVCETPVRGLFWNGIHPEDNVLNTAARNELMNWFNNRPTLRREEFIWYWNARLHALIPTIIHLKPLWEKRGAIEAFRSRDEVYDTLREFRVDRSFVIRIPFKFPHHVTITVYNYKKNTFRNILTSITSKNKTKLLDKGKYLKNDLLALPKLVMKIPGLQNVYSYFDKDVVKKTKLFKIKKQIYRPSPLYTCCADCLQGMKPFRLGFPPGIYNITFEEKPLHFSVKDDLATGENAYISSISSKQNVEKGMKMNSIVLRVNGTWVENWPHGDILEYITKSELPLHLTFGDPELYPYYCRHIAVGEVPEGLYPRDDDTMEFEVIRSKPVDIDEMKKTYMPDPHSISNDKFAMESHYNNMTRVDTETSLDERQMMGDSMDSTAQNISSRSLEANSSINVDELPAIPFKKKNKNILKLVCLVSDPMVDDRNLEANYLPAKIDHVSLKKSIEESVKNTNIDVAYAFTRMTRKHLIQSNPHILHLAGQIMGRTVVIEENNLGITENIDRSNLAEMLHSRSAANLKVLCLMAPNTQEIAEFCIQNLSQLHYIVYIQNLLLDQVCTTFYRMFYSYIFVNDQPIPKAFKTAIDYCMAEFGTEKMNLVQFKLLNKNDVSSTITDLCKIEPSAQPMYSSYNLSTLVFHNDIQYPSSQGITEIIINIMRNMLRHGIRFTWLGGQKRMGKHHIVQHIAAHVVKCERIENVLHICIDRNIKYPSDVYILFQEAIVQLISHASKQEIEGVDLSTPDANNTDLTRWLQNRQMLICMSIKEDLDCIRNNEFDMSTLASVLRDFYESCPNLRILFGCSNDLFSQIKPITLLSSIVEQIDTPFLPVNSAKHLMHTILAEHNFRTKSGTRLNQAVYSNLIWNENVQLPLTPWIIMKTSELMLNDTPLQLMRRVLDTSQSNSKISLLENNKAMKKAVGQMLQGWFQEIEVKREYKKSLEKPSKKR